MKSLTQLLSHVAPLSADIDCSQRRGGRDARPQHARLHRAALVCVVADERSDAIAEMAPHRRGDGGRFSAIEPPARPFTARIIERTQSDAAHGAGRELHDVVADIALAAQHRPVDQRSAELVPLIAADQAFAKASMLHLPAADEEIEIRRRVLQLRQRCGLLRGAREVVAPVDLPAGTVVRRERLLPPRARAVHVVPAKAHDDRSALVRIATGEGAAIALECTAHGRIDARRRAAVEPPDRPRPRGRVERAHAQAAIRSRWNIDNVVVDVAKPAQRLPEGALSGELLPLVVAGQAILQAPVPHVPAAHQPLPVLRVRGGRRECEGRKQRARRRSGGTRKELAARPLQGIGVETGAAKKRS
ncbi:MAG TPA: hypothetical protein VGE88_02195 [Lysobacter sp.]